MESENQKIFICPFCKNNKRYKSATWLSIHIRLNHDFKNLTIIFLILALLGLIFSLFSIEIKYAWDKNFGREELNANIFYNIFYPINTSSFNLSNENYELLISKQKLLGLIPPWADKDPIKYGIEDKGCAFFTYYNAPEVYDKDLKKVALEKNFSTPKQLNFEIPREEIIDSTVNCPNCFGYFFYVDNSGKRKLDKVNLKACFQEDYNIVYTSEKVYQESKNCFRINQEFFPSGENYVGYIAVRKKESVNYEDFWKDQLIYYSGNINRISKTKELSLSNATRIITSYFPNVIC